MPISSFQYQEMLLRNQRKAVAPQSDTAAVGREKDLHYAIIDFCKDRGWIYFHGSMAHKTFRGVGEPDFQIWADGGRKFAVECKARHGKLSPAQLGVIMWAEKLGHTVHIVTSIEEFREIVK